MAKLNRQESIEVNQKMLAEWAQECKEEGYLAYCALALPLDGDRGTFLVLRSDSMDSQMLIRQLEVAIVALKAQPFEKKYG